MPWTPGFRTTSNATRSRENYSLTVVARLRSGVSVQQASAELAVLSQSMKQQWPEVRASSVVAVPLQEDIVAPSRNLLQLLLIAVGLVLLVACVNVANLDARPRDGPRAGVRDPRGARLRPGRLARLLMVEMLVLAGLGGVGRGSRWRRSA